jgi:hypothetical protein
VNIKVNWDEDSSGEQPGSKKTYAVTYTLPISVSSVWQEMFQKPDPRSGVVHQVFFTFSEDGEKVTATLQTEPAPDLILVLKNYVKRANERWKNYREKVLANRPEEERILNLMKEAV